MSTSKPAILVTVWETDEATGRRQEIASHGIDPDTDQPFVVPPESPQALGAVRDPTSGLWMLNAPSPVTRSIPPRPKV